ncbi:MAG: GNAT family N-acetyltransferase [Candidatus Hodarchaeota archaeon]
MRSEDWASFELLDQEIFPDDRLEKGAFERFLLTNSFFGLEAQYGELVGYLKLNSFENRTGHLGRIGVAREHQGRGFGSLLMDFAIQWFTKHHVHQIDLYTQDFNIQAQRLYQKFGFKRIGTTWHYILPFDSLLPAKDLYTTQIIKTDEIERVAQTFSNTMSAAGIRLWLENDIVLTLKNQEGTIVGACRLTPSFPGCFPFELDRVDGLDDFVEGFRSFIPVEYDYIRLTFTDNPDLAIILDERQCKLHHRLFRMRLELTP